MRLLKRATILIVTCALLYLGGAMACRFTELSYRTWADALGKIIIIWVLPFLGILWTAVLLRGAGRRSGLGKALAISAEVIAYVCWTYCGFWILFFSMDSERMLTSNLLVTNEGFGKPFYVYYRPMTPFFKVPGALTEEDAREYLEQKYGEKFVIDPADGNAIHAVEFPEVKVRVYLSGMSLRDDFVESVLTYCLGEGMEKSDIDREYYIGEDFSGTNGGGRFYILLEDEEDIPGLAEDVSRLMDYVRGRTALLEEHRVWFRFYCGELEGSIRVGGFGGRDGARPDQGFDPESMEKVIRAEYEAAVDRLKAEEKYRLWMEEEYRQRMEEYQKEQEGLSDSDSYFDSVEQGARMIYDEVLAGQGYSYEVCYNAKGNLYINLGDRPAGEPGDRHHTGNYSFTLVYDRTSKNGACELFVLYKEHYVEKDGVWQSDATGILDMYAVEVDTGKVVAADRHAWSDAGAKEYRELTGE